MAIYSDTLKSGNPADQSALVIGAFVIRFQRALWIAPISLALLLSTIYPALFLIVLATTKSTLGKPFSAFVGFKQFSLVFSDSLFLTAVAKSIAYAFVVSTLQLAAGFAIALLFAQLLKAGRFLMSIVLLPLMTPPVMVGIAWKLMLAPAGGLLNGLLVNYGIIDQPISFLGTPYLAWVSIAVADLWQWIPFVVILCFASLGTLPESIYEAAKIDGANVWQRFWHITLPLLAAPLASIYLLKLIISFKLFDLVYVLTFGGPGFATTTAGFSIFRLAMEQFDVGKAAAETLIYGFVIGLVTLPVVRLHRKLEQDQP